MAHLYKWGSGGGLGISLEGTVDVEDGVEVGGGRGEVVAAKRSYFVYFYNVIIKIFISFAFHIVDWRPTFLMQLGIFIVQISKCVSCGPCQIVIVKLR